MSLRFFDLWYIAEACDDALTWYNLICASKDLYEHYQHPVQKARMREKFFKPKEKIYHNLVWDNGNLERVPLRLDKYIELPNGKKHGKFVRYWDLEGEVVQQSGNYHNGRKIGVWTVYNKKGKVIEAKKHINLLSMNELIKIES